MNQLERRWLTFFVANYQRITLQLERHADLYAELRDVADEYYRLQVEKEKLLKEFADVMLRMAAEQEEKKRK